MSEEKVCGNCIRWGIVGVSKESRLLACPKKRAKPTVTNPTTSTAICEMFTPITGKPKEPKE